jgi:ABC-type sugar transport system permease subunit
MRHFERERVRSRVTARAVKLRRRDVVVLTAPLGILLGGWLILPALFGFAATFTTYTPVAVPVRFVGIANYVAVIRDPEFLTSVRNIIAFSMAAIPLELLIGFGLAYALRRPFRGRGFVRVLLLVPWLLSPIGSGVMWHFLFENATGLVDFVLGWLGHPEWPSPAGVASLALPTVVAIEVWRLAPFVAFLVTPALEGVPAERWEAGLLDGLGLRRRIADIAVPAIAPLLAAIAMLLVGLSLGTFDSILILTGGGPGTATVTPALFSYTKAFGVDNWPAGSVAAWLLAFAVIGVSAVYLRVARRWA